MIARVVVAVLVAGSLVLGQTTKPTTKPAATEPHYPTPAELIAKIKERKDKEKVMPKVAYFDLSKPVTEKPEAFSLFGGDTGTTLRSLLSRLNQARDDKDLKAVLVTLEESGLNLAQAQELRDALAKVTKAGKKTYVYADSYDTTSYVVASGASDVCILEGGEIMLPGIGIEMTFAKGLLDKLGVQADYVQIGKYKGADEMFTRTGPTDEARGEINKLLDSLYDQIISGIAQHRKLDKAAVKKAVDQAMINADEARKLGLVDHLVDMEGLRELMGKELGHEVNLVRNYGKAEKQEIDFSNPFAIFALLMKRPEGTTRPTIAVVYAEGTIIDGEGGEGMFGGNSIGSKDIRQAMRLASRDENVKAIVLRIDSPGGSALASEAMWQAVRRVAGKKPVIVSVGSMAASGGYYLASSGERIFADSTAIVGSIGVVGGKFVTKGLFDKLGISTEPFKRGDNADLFSSEQPFTDAQKAMVRQWMSRTYEQFTQRVMTTRKGKIKDIDEVAQGRIFAAREAKALGMVDEIGGFDDAMKYAAKKVDLEEGDYDVQVLPPPKTLADLLYASDQDAAMPFHPTVKIAEDSVLRVMPQSLRTMVGTQLQMLQLLQQRPVILAAPFVVKMK